MPYRALEAIHTDVNPLASPFTGQLLPESQGAYVLAGKGGIISDADAAKFGLADSGLVERLGDGQLQREREERVAAAAALQRPISFRPAADADAGPSPQLSVEPEPVEVPEPVADLPATPAKFRTR